MRTGVQGVQSALFGSKEDDIQMFLLSHKDRLVGKQRKSGQERKDLLSVEQKQTPQD